MGIVGGALGFYVQGTTTTRRRRLDSLMSLTSAKTITPISYHRPSKYKEPRAYYYYSTIYVRRKEELDDYIVQLTLSLSIQPS
jgi:hypothetical protein